MSHLELLLLKERIGSEYYFPMSIHHPVSSITWLFSSLLILFLKASLLGRRSSMESVPKPTNAISSFYPSDSMPPTAETTAPGPPKIGSRSQAVPWYSPPPTSLSEIPPAVVDLLEKYSKISTSDILPQIVSTRDKLWSVFPWPCIGSFRFIDLSLSNQPSYQTILSRLRDPNEGGRLLDVGCCLAQDLRKLVHHGASPSLLYGIELKRDFIDIGYDFFDDQQGPFGAGVTLLQGDFLDPHHEEMSRLAGSFTIIHVGMVLHLFDLEGQTKACERFVELLKAEKGVMVIGQSLGDLNGRGVYIPGRGKNIYKHDAETFEEMWAEVRRRTGTEWVVRAKLDEGLGIGEQKRTWDAASSRRLSFEVERM